MVRVTILNLTDKDFDQMNGGTILLQNDTDGKGDYIKSWEENMRKIASCENFVTKISGLGMFDPKWTTTSTRIFIEKTIEIFGIERCMFASNFPVDKIFNSFDNYWNSFKEITIDYSENDKNLLFSANAEKYYRI